MKMGVPEKIILPMSQHVGAPCKPLVAKGDQVLVGQKVGEPQGFVSSPVHSSVSGTVTAISSIVFPNGQAVETIEIDTDGKQTVMPDIKPPVIETREQFIEAVRESGLVGLGGAGFPTHVKFSPPAGKEPDTLIINGAECEPYITSDYREMLENASGIIEGIKLTMKMMKIENAFLAIEDNKPEAIELLKKTAWFTDKVKIAVLKSRYPQGAEKMLISAVTGRKVPPGGLPHDVKVLVLNVNTVAFIASYARTGMPLMKKRVTIDGEAVSRPKNIEALIGTRASDVFAFAGGFKKEYAKILMGGPMMGLALYTIDMPVMKYTNALIALDAQSAAQPEESACIRCGRCVTICPVNLMPLHINNFINHLNYELLEKYNVSDCIECGSCSYICPAKRHLVQSIRLAKTDMKRIADAKTNAEKGGE
jgi:electron transport complex protein RnfC